jgi:hypothetical protein
MKYLLLLLMLGACGGDYIVSGEVTVTHKVDLASEWFIAYCKDLHPTSEALQNECVTDLMADFLDAMSGGSL